MFDFYYKKVLEILGGLITREEYNLIHDCFYKQHLSPEQSAQVVKNNR